MALILLRYECDACGEEIKSFPEQEECFANVRFTKKVRLNDVCLVCYRKSYEYANKKKN